MLDAEIPQQPLLSVTSINFHSRTLTDQTKSHTGAFAASAVKSLRYAPMNSANQKQFAPPLTAFLEAA
jgi:hypothetical protein